jgi:hypothetical protein
VSCRLPDRLYAAAGVASRMAFMPSDEPDLTATRPFSVEPLHLVLQLAHLALQFGTGRSSGRRDRVSRDALRPGRGRLQADWLPRDDPGRFLRASRAGH